MINVILMDLYLNEPKICPKQKKPVSPVLTSPLPSVSFYLTTSLAAALPIFSQQLAMLGSQLSLHKPHHKWPPAILFNVAFCLPSYL